MVLKKQRLEDAQKVEETFWNLVKFVLRRKELQ